jgi:hypothetical protein
MCEEIFKKVYKRNFIDFPKKEFIYLQLISDSLVNIM